MPLLTRIVSSAIVPISINSNNVKSMKVDILSPNDFSKTGVVKDIGDAWNAGDWIGSFNLWIVQHGDNNDYVLYQQRPADALWAPGTLDVAAGGHYEAGEEQADGVREAREELGRNYRFEELTYLGKKLYLRDDGLRKLRYAVDVFITCDATPLREFEMQRKEVDALYRCSIEDLIRVHTEPAYKFVAEGIGFDEDRVVNVRREVLASSFPFNWDRYHFKMALIARRFVHGEKGLLY